MQPGKGMANDLFSCKFVSICKWVPTSSKHRILPLPPLSCLPFRLSMRIPSKDSNCPPLQQANMQSGKGMANNLFSCKFVSICKWFQTSFKHRLPPLPPLPCLPFRLSMRNIDHRPERSPKPGTLAFEDRHPRTSATTVSEIQLCKETDQLNVPGNVSLEAFATKEPKTWNACSSWHFQSTNTISTFFGGRRPKTIATTVSAKQIHEESDRCNVLGNVSLEAQNPKSKIQNPKSKIQNPKSKIQNPKSKIQNPKSKIQNPNSKIQNPKSKIQKPKTKNQKPTDRPTDHPTDRQTDRTTERPDDRLSDRPNDRTTERPNDPNDPADPNDRTTGQTTQTTHRPSDRATDRRVVNEVSPALVGIIIMVVRARTDGEKKRCQ
jgi:hypothetical protein